MTAETFEYILKIGALFWINAFFLISTALCIFVWIAVKKSQDKVHSTLDTVQGIAFSVYQGFDQKSSRMAGIVGALLNGLFMGRRRK